MVGISLFAIFLSETPNKSKFLAWIITLDVFIAVKLIFLIFCNHPHQDLILAIFDPLTAPPLPIWHPSPPAILIPAFLFFVSNKSKKRASSSDFNWFYDFSTEWGVCRYLLFWGLFPLLWAVHWSLLRSFFNLVFRSNTLTQLLNIQPDFRESQDKIC